MLAPFYFVVLTTRLTFLVQHENLLLHDFFLVNSYDLSQKEQADFIKLDGANLLTVTGEALIKCPKEGIIDLQVPYVSDKDIQNVVNFITSQNIKK